MYGHVFAGCPLAYIFPRSFPLRNLLFHLAMESLLLIKLAFVELYDYGAVFFCEHTSLHMRGLRHQN